MCIRRANAASIEGLGPSTTSKAPGQRTRFWALALGHWRPLFLGLLSSLGYVGACLALPWPLGRLTSGEPWGPGDLPSWVNLGVLFAVLVGSMGYFDFQQRLHFARFAIGWSRELRASALQTTAGVPPTALQDTGDLVARVISDVARFKAGVKISLVYVLTNILMLSAATVIVGIQSFGLGLLVGATGLIAVAVALRGARGTLAAYLEHRRLEGRLAAEVVGRVEEDDGGLQESSSEYEVTDTRAQVRTTSIAHVLVGAFLCTALIVGARGIASGDSPPSVLVVFVAYAFLLSKPVVRLTRHGARLGKLVACSRRLLELMHAGDERAPGRASGRRRGFRMLDDGLRITWPGGRGARDVVLRPSERVLVLDVAGEGRRALLRALCGRPADGGPQVTPQVTWDEVPLGRLSHEELTRLIGEQPLAPSWRKKPLYAVLGSGGPNMTDRTREILADLGLVPLIQGLPRQLGCALSSRRFSTGERRRIVLASLLHRWRPVLVLDDPFLGCSVDEMLAVQRRVFQETTGALVVVGSSVPAPAAGFDRIIELDAEQVVFDGTTAAWIATGGSRVLSRETG